MEISVKNKYKKVTGVLNYNIDTRNEHLRRNLGKYSQYEEELAPAIGESYKIDYNRPLVDITNGKSLLNYTHNESEEYGRFINDRYFAYGEEKETVGFDDHILREDLMKWRGKYPNYVSYLDEVLGEDIYSRHVRYVNDFLSGQFIENALRQTEVGVVRNINVAVAKQGVITTNLNNMSGKDTPLGTITNYMYANSLYNGAIFNSDRHSENKYLTPTLINQYGNNLSNVMELGDMLRVGTNDYNIKEDLSADAYILDLKEPLKGSLNLMYITEQVDRANKYVTENYDGYKGYYEIGKDGYVNIEGRKGGKIQFSSSWFDGTNTKTINKVQKEYEISSKINEQMIYLTYNETDIANGGSESSPSINSEKNQFDQFIPDDTTSEIDNILNDKSLLHRTSQLFNEHKINTLIGRFHTTLNDDPAVNNRKEFIDTAKSKFGNSHGRNLLTRKAQETGIGDNRIEIGNGYDNPYCRTWTYHHQYNQVKKLIRPFMDEEGNIMSVTDVQNRLARYRSRYKLSDKTEMYGGKYLGENTVLNNNNGFVNICPSNDANDTVNIKNCMFSLENLAWKDVNKDEKFNYISKEQTGPNGGRIMWFPPYDLSFQENVNVDWEQSTFIGRGEKVYTYKNTNRTGTLSFTMLIDHPSIVNSFARLTDENGGNKYKKSGEIVDNPYAVSNDIDADILRFFAGCDIPDIPAPEKPEDSGGTTTKQEVKIEGKTANIIFDVYFPNNFSGTMTKNRSAKYFPNNSEGTNGNQYDETWWKYILFGNNSGFYDDPSKWIGYEVKQGVGISSGTVDEQIKDDWQCVCATWAEKPGRSDVIGQECMECWIESNKETGKNMYKYKVDPDLQQKLYSEINYSDTDSFQMNSKFNGERGDHSGFSFAEVVCALLKSGKIKWDGSTSVDTAVEYLVNNGGVDMEEVNWLTELFSNDKITYNSVKFEGSATRKDQKNSDMLAMRRSISVRKLLEESLFNKTTEEDFQKDYSGKSADLEKGQSVKSVSCKEDKTQRSTHVVIEFKYPDTTTKLEDNSAAATTPKQDNGSESGSTSGETDEFTVWYNTMIEGSSIMSLYKDMFEREQYQKDYEIFKRSIRETCNELGITDFNVNNYNEERWVETVETLLTVYGNLPDVGTVPYHNDTQYLPYVCGMYNYTEGTAYENERKTEIFFEKFWERKVYGELNDYYSENIPNITDITEYVDDNYIEYEKFEYDKLHTYGDETNTVIFDTTYFNISPIPFSSRKMEMEYLVIKYLLKDVDEGFDGVCDTLFNNEERYRYYQFLSVTREYFNKMSTAVTFKNTSDYLELPMYLYENYFKNAGINGELNEVFNVLEDTNDLYDTIYHEIIRLSGTTFISEELIEAIDNLNVILKDYVCSDGSCQIDIDAYIIEHGPVDYGSLKHDIQIQYIALRKKMAEIGLPVSIEKTEKINSGLINYGNEYVKDVIEKLEQEAKQIFEEKRKAEEERQAAITAEQKKQNDIYQKFNGTLVTRYETEADYFSKLEKDSPLIFKSLKDKFKHFNPAFHSMSPEGFNARLNFLQQCTRQGHTVEVGNVNGSKSANNLAFGRMPVCVLRIGDFINTRVIIQNMSIQYDNNGGMTWDLNPEGIGVQPMYAKISLGIVLLGGQSLEGPINRLQNAVTFDYYANTGVYDDRADRAKYVGNNGEQMYTHVWVASETTEKKDGENQNGQVTQEIQDQNKPITKIQEEVDANAKR